jgi:hypothetical protein
MILAWLSFRLGALHGASFTAKDCPGKAKECTLRLRGFAVELLYPWRQRAR